MTSFPPNPVVLELLVKEEELFLSSSLIPTLKRENLWRKPEMDFAQLYSRSIDEMIIDQRILNRIQQEMDFYVLPHFPTTPHLLRYP